MKRALSSLLTLAALAALIAGCGNSESKESSTSSSTATQSASTSTSTPASAPSSSTESGSSALKLEANPEGQLAYNTKSLSAKAGKVSIDFTNKSSLPHNLTIESSSGGKVGATPTFSGGSKSLSVSLKPGTYKFFCSIPGHRQAGMEGTLVVK